MQIDSLLVGVVVKSSVVFLIVFNSNFHKKNSFVNNLLRTKCIERNWIWLNCFQKNSFEEILNLGDQRQF